MIVFAAVGVETSKILHTRECLTVRLAQHHLSGFKAINEQTLGIDESTELFIQKAQVG
jgi:hypothetical protein